MSHLIAISIGPVQDFIAAARRTNDLYAGSAMLQEVTQAAARAIAEAGGRLIFPACAETRGANKILAALPEGDPRKTSEAAEQAARRVLIDAFEVALRDGLAGVVKEDLCRQQLAHFIEFYAAWWPWDGQDATYRNARIEVERLLAGRKALREFVQPCKHLWLKSPLDPARDTVLDDTAAPVLTRMPYWLKPNEWLDIVSLLKRKRGEGLRVPSTVDIAAEAFLVGEPDISAWIEGQRLSNGQKMPRGVVFESRRDELYDEGKMTAEQHAEVVRLMGKKEPNPYFGILVADGDRMGDAIGRIANDRDHADFSRKLSLFAETAQEIVAAAKGHLVYCGGDDVLAFLPVHTTLECAAELAQHFNKDTGLTLSAGVAIVHCREPLYLTLDLARAAEREAKEKGRNGLYVEWHTRGGQSRGAWHSWTSGYDLAGWQVWRKAFEEGFTRGFAYELAALARECKAAEFSGALLREEADRIFERKDDEGKPRHAWEETLAGVESSEDLQELSALLVLMQALAAKSPQAQEVTP